MIRRRLRRPVLALTLAATTLLGVGTLGPASPAQAAPPPGSSVGVTADTGALVWQEEWLSDRELDIVIWSPGLRTLNSGFAPVRLLFPEGWSRDANRTWPLVVALHGGNDGFNSWTRETTIEELSATSNAIVAMPDGGYSASYVDYYNGGKGGSPMWETFHNKELLQILERGYRAGTSRAIIGLSAGGFGAMSYAARNPGTYKYAASYSGALALTLPGNRFATTVLQGLADADPNARLGPPIQAEANWRAHDPYRLVKKFKGTGIQLYASSGTTGFPASWDTEPYSPAAQLGEVATGIQTQAFLFQAAINGVKVTSDIYPFGYHDWASWQRQLDKTWPAMMKAIGG